MCIPQSYQMLVLEQNHIPDGHATAKDLVSPLQKSQEHLSIFDSHHKKETHGKGDNET